MRFETALSVALIAHAGQKDKAGDPYILHPLRVATHVHSMKYGSSDWDLLAAVAVLHDVIEDTGITLEELTKEPDPLTRLQAEWLDALTHRPNEPRIKYIGRILLLPGAKLIKWCDIADNVSRLGRIPDDETRGRLASKYAQELQWLQRGLVS